MSANFDHELENETPPTSVETSVLRPEDEVEKENEPVEETVKPTVLPSLKDLPSLCSNNDLAKTKVSWGPNVKPAVHSNISSSPSPSPSPINSGSKPMRSKTIQEAFTLDLQSQLSITKPEFSRIVQSVKQNHNVSVESTLSKNSRTFLISGYPENVRSGRRELVKKLTKPVTEVFQVPSSAKAAIIGSGGKTIREVQDSFGVRINLARENNEDSYDEDLDDFTSDISIHGDIDSVKLAKQKVLEIVKEETKNASIKISSQDATLIPFIDLTSLDSQEGVQVQFFESSGDILISGPRDDAKTTKTVIQNYLKKLETEIAEEKVAIPTKFQFLIDVDEIKEKFNVVVKLPVLPTGDEKVSFFGARSKIQEAIEFARSSSKTYAVDALDISKSHSKNLSHAKNLVLYFNKYGTLKSIQDAHPTTKILLPSPAALAVADNVTILISGKSDETDEIKTVRKELISLVNDISPHDTLTIEDLDYQLFHKEIKHILLGHEDQAGFVQFGDYYPGNDSIILVALTSNEDFKPSVEEIGESLSKINASLDPLRNKQSNLESKIFELDSKTQDSLFDESNVTLGLILEEASQEQGHLQVKLHTPGENQITLRGNEKAVKIATKAFDSIVASPSKKSKITVEVPSNSVSRLIGSKGSHTQQIREKFDIQMDVPSESENGKSVEVTLTGLQYNIGLAKTFVAAEAKKWADIISKELIAGQKYHRNLIGPQSVYRNRLQDKYSVRIFFPRDEDVVTIKGPSRGVAKAYDELKALLDFEMENGHKTIIKVPAEHVPRVIGKSGEMINDIRADFGVNLDFLQNVNDAGVKESGEVELEITGSRQAIKDAAKKVESIVADAADFVKKTIDVDRKYHRVIVGSGGHNLREIITRAGGDEYRNKYVDIPKPDSESQIITVEGPKKFVEIFVKEINKIVEEGENSITKELDIPSERQGSLVGPGGVVRRQLESEFHVTMKVPNKGEQGKVSITGLPANVDKAEKKIFSDIIRDNFDHELQVPAKYHEFVSERGAFIRKLRIDKYVGVRHGNGTKTANKITRRSIDIPVEKARGTDEEKIKFTIEEIASSEDSDIAGEIPWRLSYEPIDLDELLGEEDKTKESKDEESDAKKKQTAIDEAIKLIEERISMAPNANFVGYVWSSDPKKFNKIIGPGGSNIKKIREATGTVINVPKRSDKIDDVVYIKGTKEGVEKAGEMITKNLKN